MSLIPEKYLVIILYLLGLSSLISSIVVSFQNLPVAIPQISLSLLLLVLGVISKTEYSLVKVLDTKFYVMIWAVVSIIFPFLPNIFAYSAQSYIAWIGVAVSISSLLAIFFAKIEQVENA
jgi:hypothetical protein